MAIAKGYVSNFNTLIKAVENGDAVLLECQNAVTKNPVITICAMQREQDGTFTMVPLAKMFDGNPYQELLPPEVPELQA